MSASIELSQALQELKEKKDAKEVFEYLANLWKKAKPPQNDKKSAELLTQIIDSVGASDEKLKKWMEYTFDLKGASPSYVVALSEKDYETNIKEQLGNLFDAVAVKEMPVLQQGVIPGIAHPPGILRPLVPSNVATIQETLQTPTSIVNVPQVQGEGIKARSNPYQKIPVQSREERQEEEAKKAAEKAKEAKAEEKRVKEEIRLKPEEKVPSPPQGRTRENHDPKFDSILQVISHEMIRVKGNQGGLKGKIKEVGAGIFFASQAKKYIGLDTLKKVIEKMRDEKRTFDPATVHKALQKAIEADKKAHVWFSSSGEVQRILNKLIDDYCPESANAVKINKGDPRVHPCAIQ